MDRLLRLEWLKLRHYRPFWVLFSMYVAGVTVVCSSGMFLMNFIKSKGGDIEGIDPTRLPLYDFPDVWQNMSWVALFLKVILGFIMIISVANEINFKTIRQNMIDGMSEWEWLSSKLVLRQH